MDYQRQQSRFAISGVCLNCAPDNVPDGKLSIATNVRSTKKGTLTTRAAIAALLTPATTPIHSLKSFNAGGVNRTFSGAGTKLYMDATQVDTGYSGNPLTFAAYQPAAAVQPFLYAADGSRYSKLRASDGVRYGVGSAPPGTPANAEIGIPLYSVVNDFDTVGSWTSTGVGGTVSSAVRVPAATTTAAVLYDTGTTGWACVAFNMTSTSWLTKGVRIIVNAEGQVVSDMIPAGATTTTTIAAIHYDVGTTGACCVVLTRNTDQLDRNSLLKLNAEFVRVLSVAVGEDNSFSFRCVTTGAHAAAETVAFYDSARMYFTGTHAAAEAVTGSALSTSFTTTGGATSASGVLTLAINLDLSQISNRAITADDWMHISMMIDVPANLISAQLYLNIDAATSNFQSNAFWCDITSNVLQAASTGSQSLLAAQQNANAQQDAQAQQINGLLSELKGLQAALAAMQNTPANPTTTLNQISVVEAQIIAAGGNYNTIVNQQPIPVSSQLAVGASAWSEIFIPISTLLAGRIGTDVSKTLANVNVIGIQIVCSGPVTLTADSWWIGGTYGPNAPESLYPDNPIKYCYRYRSTITGAQTTWSPLNRGGVFPERMPVVVTGACSADAQIDTVDIARVGASVNGTPLYAASIPNTGATWSWTDNFADAQLADPIEQTDFQPWPIQQGPITGTCSVVGTTVFSTSVTIPTNLCIGTEVVVNGAVAVIRGAPLTNGFQLEENIATGTVVPFQINSPTTYGNPLPYLAGPFDETFFAWGDTVNPGRLYYSNRTNPETANTSNFIDLTSSAEPGLGLCTYNGYVVAMTADRFFAGTVSGNTTNPYSFAETSVGAGLLVPWAFDVGPLIFFLSKNGILATDLSPAHSLSGDDLYPFLPHEGQAGVAVNGYSPPVLSPVPRLSFCRNGWLYFDYQMAAGGYASLAMNTLAPGWWVDTYSPGVTLHAQSEAANSILVLVGCADGSIQKFAANAADSGGAIACQARTNAWGSNDIRAPKQFQDFFVDCDASGTIAGIVATLLADNWASTLATATLSGAQNVARIPTAQTSPYGSFHVNAAMDFVWTGIGVLYGYEITALLAPVPVTLFQPQPTSHGLKGYQTVREVRPVVQGTGACVITATCEFGSFSLPVTLSGLLQKLYLRCPPNKGQLYTWTISGAPVLVFEPDFEVIVKEWGSNSAFQVIRPFGEQGSAGGVV